MHRKSAILEILGFYEQILHSFSAKMPNLALNECNVLILFDRKLRKEHSTIRDNRETSESFVLLFFCLH